MYLGLRIVAGALWAVAFALLVAVISADALDRKLVLYSWCMFLCFMAGTLTILLALEHVIQRESARNARVTAEAVGEAVAQVIAEDASVTRITRRGT